MLKDSLNNYTLLRNKNYDVKKKFDVFTKLLEESVDSENSVEQQATSIITHSIDELKSDEYKGDIEKESNLWYQFSTLKDACDIQFCTLKELV